MLRGTDNASWGQPTLFRGAECFHSYPHNYGGFLATFPVRLSGTVPFLSAPCDNQDRLYHVQLLFTWNPSPLQFSRFVLEYLLLPPRSVHNAAP